MSYEKFELWVMFSLCFSHVAIIMSPFRSSIYHFLAKLWKFCEIFCSCEKKTMKLSLIHKNVNTSSHRKGNLMTLTAVYRFELWLKVRDMPSKLSLPRQGPWNLVWVKQVYELSEVELTESHCILHSLDGAGILRPLSVYIEPPPICSKSYYMLHTTKKTFSIHAHVHKPNTHGISVLQITMQGR